MIDNDLVQWQQQLPSNISHIMRQLILESGSLTQALSRQCGQEIQVDILFEGVVNRSNEASCWAREVLLLCREEYVLYALSKIAFNSDQAFQAFISDQHPFSALQHLGNRPLGYWLGQQTQLSRSRFDYAMLDASIHLPVLALPELPQMLPARRSFLWKDGQSLELTEIFLRRQ